MSHDPCRTIEEGGASMIEEGGASLEVAMLRAARADAAPEGAKRRALEALGIEERAARGPAARQAIGARRAERCGAGGAAREPGGALFDAVLRRGDGRPAGPFSTSALITVTAHAAMLALLLAQRGGAPVGARGVDIHLVESRPAAAAARAPVIPFGAGMDPPRWLSGSDPVYTREALAARVEGVAEVECVITTEGALTGCRLLRAIPHMGQAVLEAMTTRRYAPVLQQGRPVAVSYVFRIDLVLPE